MHNPDCVGREMLLNKFGSIQNVARAYVQGRIESCLQRHVRDVCDTVDIVAAAEWLRQQEYPAEPMIEQPEESATLFVIETPEMKVEVKNPEVTVEPGTGVLDAIGQDIGIDSVFVLEGTEPIKQRIILIDGITVDMHTNRWVLEGWRSETGEGVRIEGYCGETDQRLIRIADDSSNLLDYL